MKYKHGLSIILIAYVLVSLTYIWQTPIFEGPDESSHFTVVHYIRHRRRLPPYSIPDWQAATAEDMTWFLLYHDPPLYYSPPLYYILAAGSVFWTEMDDLPDLLIPNPNWERGWPPEANSDTDNKNVYAHLLSSERLVKSPTVQAVKFLRVLGMGAGALTLWSIYALGQQLWPEHPILPLAATALAAFTPKFIAVSITVGHHSLFNALSGLLIWKAVHLLNRPPRWQSWATLGAVTGLAFLTKQSALLLLPLIMITIILQARNHGKGWGTMLRSGLIFSLVVFLVSGWWYAYHALRYQDPLALQIHYTTQVGLERLTMANVWNILRTYWSGFGWGTILLHEPVYWGIALFLGVGCAGMVMTLRRRGAFWQLPPTTQQGMGMLALFLALNMVSLIKWSIDLGAPDGRLLMPALSPIVLLWVWGLSLDGSKRWVPLPILTAIGAFVCAALVPWTALKPAFSSTRLARTPIQNIRQSEAHFEHVIMEGYRLTPSENLHPGEEIGMTFIWESKSSSVPLSRVWVQLGPRDATAFVSGINTWLGGTLYPSNLWKESILVEQDFTLNVPNSAPAPALYWMRVGLTTEEGQSMPTSTGERALKIGPWRMIPTERPPAPAIVKKVRLDSIRLIGYDWSCRESENSVIPELTLHWRAEREPTSDYAVFIHAFDEDQNLVLQWDGPPREGSYPTSWWLSKQVILDPHLLSGVSPDHNLLIGLYDPVSKERIPATDTSGARYPNDAIQLQPPPACSTY